MSTIAEAKVINETSTELTVQITLRKATGFDVARTKKLLRRGVLYWERDKSGKICNKPHIIDELTDTWTLNQLMGKGQIYVPATWNDSKIYR